MAYLCSDMRLVTTSVVTDHKMLLPWTITQFSDSCSIMEFFDSTLKPRLDEDCSLHSALVGKEKHLLDLVDINLPLVAVIPAYGQYLQYKVANTIDDIIVPEESLSLSFPGPIAERNRKDALYNKIVTFFNSSSVGLPEEELSLGKKLLITLRDIFWYIDNHHHVFDRVKKPIPMVFHSFIGFNTPELSKHRKRRTTNISADKLKEFAMDLSQILLQCYWDRENWRNIKEHLVALFSSLSCYSEHLFEKNKSMKQNHRSPTPVRELSEHLTLKFLERSEDVPPSLIAIDQLVTGLPMYIHSSIDYLLPSDSLKKHRLVNSLIQEGLSCPSMLLIYSPGGSIANLYFMWQVPCDLPDKVLYFEDSQATIERIRVLLPTFHTRAMRKAFFEKFGRISNKVKPLALRYFYKEVSGIVIAHYNLPFILHCLLFR